MDKQKKLEMILNLRKGKQGGYSLDEIYLLMDLAYNEGLKDGSGKK